MADGRGWIRLGVVGLGMAFCLFFGVSLATQGTERIHGPLTPGAAGVSAGPVRASGGESGAVKKPSGTEAKSTSAQAEGKGASGKQQVKPSPQQASKPAPKRAEEPATETGINRVGNKTGELLQIVAYHGIRGVVSLFERLLK
ncbi:hypothetical protein SAMN02799630_01254 [Paenibacillus sp. UNCCL117]|uniref:hypothetical protein n=1 Tax=unclassified Paenibacillus TaxID=185978 RepID=UPI00088B8AEB|nr:MULTISPECIES: hypothetical protein [unclassified Paenibacillus]SDC71120.1 hypothetical protein SAMN04488602_103232 [Paenibacillus sp. cl123]SFW24376.1 hypothetical protein SAMN02799630_01254 [Paenibacillus sp. UNCCL117]